MYYYDIETQELMWTTEHLNVLRKARTVKDSVIVTDEQLEQYTVCDDCGKIINKNNDDEYYYITYDDCIICEDCYCDSYFTCEDCGEIHHIDNKCIAHDSSSDEKWICESCADSDYYRCSECGEYYTSSYITTDSNNDSLCDDCRERLEINICEDCGRFVSEGDGQWCEDDDCFYCDSCYDEHCPNDIHNYGYTPDLEYHSLNNDDNSLYYGFELEISVDRSTASDYLSYFNDNEIYLTNDSSIVDGGYEITSHPMTYNYLMDDSDFLKRFTSSLTYLQQEDAEGHNKGGLHIHIDNTYISDLQLAAMAAILYNSLNSDEYNTILTITQRKQCNLEDWGTLNRDNYADNKERFFARVYQDGKITSNKYTGINTNHNHTIEFRIFNSNLRIDRLKKNFQFVKALHDYTKEVLNKYDYHFNKVNIDDLSIYKLINYVFEHSSDYQELISFLYEKEIITKQLPLLLAA